MSRARPPRPLGELQAVVAERASAAGVVGRSNTRERILEVAIELFAAKGFGACTVKDLASAAGIKPPGLYAHFASKEAILAEAMVRALADFIVYVNVASDAVDDAELALQHLVERHVLYQLEHLRVTRANDLLLNSEAIGHFLPEEDHQLLVDVQRSYMEHVRDRVRAALPPGSPIDVVPAAFAIITMCDRVTVWFRADGRYSARDVAAQYWTFVRGMLGLSPN